MVEVLSFSFCESPVVMLQFFVCSRYFALLGSIAIASKLPVKRSQALVGRHAGRYALVALEKVTPLGQR